MNINYNKDQKELLSIFFKVVQSSLPDFIGEDEWKGYAHGVALKFYRHITTIRKLFPPKFDSINGDRYVDFATLKVIERAAFENFLVFAHIYGAKDAKLGELRFLIWKCCGLMARQKLKLAHEYKDQIEFEKKQIDELWARIKLSPLYDQFSKPRKDRLEGGDWMGVNKMSDLAKEASVQFYYEKMYKHTSGYGHTGFLSVMQVNQANDLPTQIRLAELSLGTSLVIMANFLTIFTSLSPIAKQVLDSDPNVPVLFAMWNFRDQEWYEAIEKNRGQAK